jgi:hypothetical protein
LEHLITFENKKIACIDVEKDYNGFILSFPLKFLSIESFSNPGYQQLFDKLFTSIPIPLGS